MKKALPYLIAIVILIIGGVAINYNDDVGAILMVCSIMFMVFYPLLKLARKKEKEQKEHKKQIQTIINEKTSQGINKNLICKNCGSDKVDIQMVAEKKGTGCLMIIIYIILFITLIGWLILIPIILSSKSKTKKYAICQNCGNSWHLR